MQPTNRAPAPVDFTPAECIQTEGNDVKQLVLVCLLAQCGSVFAVDDAYCDGFVKGFSQRYCVLLQKASADALPPSCPDPVLGADSAQDGYNRGFLVGLNAARVCEDDDPSAQDEQARVSGPGATESAEVKR
jgi:hypothetical protein